MKIIQNILTLLLVLLTAGFLAVSSFTFGTENKTHTLTDSPTVLYATARVSKTEFGVSFIDKVPYTKREAIMLEKGTS